MGLRLDWLGTRALSWRDLLVIVRQLPIDSAVSRSMNPKTWEWSLSVQMLALLFNATVGKPAIKVPGDSTDALEVGSGAVPMDEFERFWNNDGGG